MLDCPVPDMFGRPWARISEQSFDRGMRPRKQEVDIFDFR